MIMLRLLCLACLVACAVPRPAATARGETLDWSRATPPLDTATQEQVVAWSLGTTHRMMEPSRAEMRLLVLPAAAAPTETALSQGCFDASAMLPAPPPDPLFYIITTDGQLAVLHKGGRPEVVTLPADLPMGLRFARLLAFSTAGPPRLLATVRIADGGTEEVWQLRLQGRVLVAATQVRRHPDFASAEAFFSAYQVPRCQAGGKRCLVLGESDGRFFLDMEGHRGATREPLKVLGEREVRDASWAGSGAIYLLASCR